MKLLEDRIRKDGIVLNEDVLKVGSFLNHQMDVALLEAMGREFYRLFADSGVNKILTIEASGIGIAVMAAQAFGCPVVFAKKSKTSNLGADVYSARAASFTHGNVNTVVVERAYLTKEDRVLLIDDFLANGEALRALRTVAQQAGATVVGAGVVIEKAFQRGGADLRAEGLRVEALARVKCMRKDYIEFC